MYNPNSLLCESVTGGELHRHWAFFTGTGLAFYRQTRAPPCATLTSFEPTGHRDDTKEGKRTPIVPSATTGPLPGEGSSRPPRQRAYLRVSPGVARCGEGPCSWLPPGGPQRVSLAGRCDVVPGSSIGIAT